MVTYGPWQGSKEYTETWTLGIIPSGDLAGKFGVIERTMTPYPAYVDGSTPPTIAQWSGFGGLRPGDLWGRESRASEVALEGPPEVADPRWNTSTVSADAWERTQTASPNTHNDFGSAEAGVAPAGIQYSSTFEAEVGSFGWIVQREGWVVQHTEYTPRYSVRANIDQPFIQIPPAPTPQHLYAELDPARRTVAKITEAVSLKVDFVAGDPRWHFFIKDIGVTSPGWLVGFEPVGDRTVNGMKSGSFDMGNEGTFEFDVALINEWKVLGGNSSQAFFVPAALLPHVGIAWTGGWPGDWKAPAREYPADPVATFTYKFNTPNWRWVLDSSPYRRTTGRTDNLAGGPTRNYPPSKAMQSGNRTSGGHW